MRTVAVKRAKACLAAEARIAELGAERDAARAEAQQAREQRDAAVMQARQEEREKIRRYVIWLTENPGQHSQARSWRGACNAVIAEVTRSPAPRWETGA